MIVVIWRVIDLERINVKNRKENEFLKFVQNFWEIQIWKQDYGITKKIETDQNIEKKAKQVKIVKNNGHNYNLQWKFKFW